MSTDDANTTKEDIRLAVDFAEKDIVKALGARWNPQERFWFVPVGHCNRDIFAKWFPKDGDRIEKTQTPTKAPAPRIGRVQFDGIKLKVSFAEKDQVKVLGARWNAEERYWYIPAGHSNPSAFAKWLVESSPGNKAGNGLKRQRDDFQDRDCGGYLQEAMEYGRECTIKEMRRLNCPRGFCIDFWKYGECMFQNAQKESARCPYTHRLPFPWP